ncbi:MAG: cell division protein FtsX [Bacteroidetes bacterium]|nr:cell division protein FtsX [Bacteroidota bacterium]
MASNSVSNKFKTSSVTVIVSLTLVLFLLAFLAWCLLNAEKLKDYYKENIGFQIYLKETASLSDIEKLRKDMDAAIYVKSAVYKSKEEAAEEMKQETGDDFVAFLGYNPLPNSVNVKLKSNYANADSVAWIEKEISSNRIVKEVVYQKVLIENINSTEKRLSYGVSFFTMLLVIISVGLINNTIRLSIYSKRFLIRTMYLVGATQGFIRKPFIIKGIINGVIAAVLAMTLLGTFIFIATRYIPELLIVQDENWLLMLFGIVIVIGILISGLSSALSVRRYLRLKAEDLYF